MRAGASSRRVGAMLLLYILPVVAPLVLWTAWKDHVKPTLTGDEPHYLVMADSLVHDHDFDVANNYTDPNGIQALFPGLRPDHAADARGDGHLRPVQGIGMAFVLTPAIIKGTSKELAEFIWARRVMVFLSALLAGQLFLYLRALAPRPWWVAWLAWGAWCIAMPVVGYSNQLYPSTIVSARVTSPLDAYVRDLRVIARTKPPSLDDPVR